MKTRWVPGEKWYLQKRITRITCWCEDPSSTVPSSAPVRCCVCTTLCNYLHPSSAPPPTQHSTAGFLCSLGVKLLLKFHSEELWAVFWADDQQWGEEQRCQPGSRAPTPPPITALRLSNGNRLQHFRSVSAAGLTAANIAGADMATVSVIASSCPCVVIRYKL